MSMAEEPEMTENVETTFDYPCEEAPRLNDKDPREMISVAWEGTKKDGESYVAVTRGIPAEVKNFIQDWAYENGELLDCSDEITEEEDEKGIVAKMKARIFIRKIFRVKTLN